MPIESASSNARFGQAGQDRGCAARPPAGAERATQAATGGRTLVQRLRGGALPATLLLALATGCAASGAESPAPEAPSPGVQSLSEAQDLRQRLAEAVDTRQRPVSQPRAGSGAGDYLVALFARRHHDFGAAADYMDRTLMADPYNPGLMSTTMMLMASEGRMQRAFELAEILSEASPDQAPAALLLSARAIDEGRPAEARERMSNISTSGLGALVVPMMGGWAAAADGDNEAAVEALEPLFAIDGFEALAAVHTALVHDLAGDQAAAEQSYMQAFEDPQGIPVRLALMIGNFLERSGQLASAIQLYDGFVMTGAAPQVVIEARERAVAAQEGAGGEVEPIVATAQDGAAEALFNLAALLAQEGGGDSALVYLRTALYLRPDLIEAKLLLAEIMHDQGRLEGTVEVYRGVPEDSPYYHGAQIELGQVLYEAGDIEEAIETLVRAGEAVPDDETALERLGNLYRAESRFEEAADTYGQAVARIDVPERRDWTLFYFYGIALERSDRWDEAEEAFLTALELEPEQPHVMNYLAYSWVEQKRHLEKAQEMLRRAVELRPEDGYIVDSLGWVYYRLGNYEQAVTYLERAVELRPQDPVINDHLGDAYWQVGRRNEARFQWKRALSLDPEEEEVALIEEKLEHGLTKRADAT